MTKKQMIAEIKEIRPEINAKGLQKASNAALQSILGLLK